MAVTVKLNKKIERLDLVKTALSHGWFIKTTIQDDARKINDEITSADISVYDIRGTIDGKLVFILYQPHLDEMTIIAKRPEIEDQVKNKIGYILETGRKGTFSKDNKEDYVRELNLHKTFLTTQELNTLIKEARTEFDGTLNYIA